MLLKVYSFLIITQIARDYLVIPAILAPSKRVFSIAGNLVLKKRTRVSSKNIRYVLYLRSWGLLEEVDNEEEIQIGADRKVIIIVDNE